MPSLIGDDDGSGFGVRGTSPTDTGIVGDGPKWAGVVATSVSGSGVSAFSDTGAGVKSFSNSGPGVSGQSINNVGVLGQSDHSGGVKGLSADGTGVHGESQADNGVLGTTKAKDRSGVFGRNAAEDGGTGTVGLSEGLGGIGVFGSAERRGVGVVGTGATGMLAQGDAGPGLQASSRQVEGVTATAERNGFAGVLGHHRADGPGVRGQSEGGSGVEGRGRPGVLGEGAGGAHGVVGRGGDPPGSGWPDVPVAAGVIGHATGVGAAGVRAWADSGNGVEGVAEGGLSAGVEGCGPFGVRGITTVAGLAFAGVQGSAPANGVGVQGVSSSNGVGVWGLVDGDGIGVFGSTRGNGTGVFGFSGHPQNIGTLCWAGLFQGAVNVTGPVHKSGGGFLIDHPLDPANRYLHHAFVESDAMRNLYDGVVELDAGGTATVALPQWFDALNGNRLCYQLTPLGNPAPDLHVRRELEGGRFEIAGGQPGQRVCWQITGVRHDPWAKTNALPCEFDKPERERGLYRHPELYGLPPERGINARLVQAVQEAGERARRRREQ